MQKHSSTIKDEKQLTFCNKKVSFLLENINPKLKYSRYSEKSTKSSHADCKFDTFHLNKNNQHLDRKKLLK